MVRKSKLIVLLLWLVWGGLPALAQPPAPAPPQPGARLLEAEMAEALRRGRIMMNYENIDLRVLARLMAELTGRNIVLDDRVQGRVTVLSSREVTPAEAWDIFKVALERYGFAVVPKPGFVQIIPLADARRTAPVVGRPRTGANGEIVMAVLLFRHADVNVLQNVVRPLLSEVGYLSAYPPGQAIIVVDRESVVARVAELARQLDVAHPSQHVSIVFPQYAEAEALVPVLQQLLLTQIQQQAGTERLSIQAFPPANAVITHGTAAQIQKVKELIARLDVPRAAPEEVEEPRFYVYPLQNAKAEDIAKILSEMLAEKAQAQRQIQEQDPRGRPTTPATPSPTTSDEMPRADVLNPYATNLNAARGPKESVPFVSAKVASDPETNSLIFFVSPSEYEDLKNLVSVLDLPRRQVLVSAVVAEVSLSRVLDRNAVFQAITSGGILTAFNGGLSEEGLLSFLASGNFVVGTAGKGTRTIEVNGRDVNVPEFFAFIGAEDNTSDFNLISAPRVLTEDHKEAEMNVGDVVPFATGARFDNFGQPLITYDYRDVGIKLKVTPHVSQSNRIRLELEQEVQEVTDFLEQNIGGFGYIVPLISNRNVNTTVTVEDGQTLLIGGLISKRTIETLRKVPILGDIPLIREFFRETHKEEEKTTLFISLTPHIVETPTDVARIDRPYQEFLHGKQTPKDHQVESRETRPSPYEVPNADGHDVPNPYESIETEPSVTRTLELLPGVHLSEFRLMGRAVPGSEAPGVVRVINGDPEAAELVLITTVRLPDGSVKEFRTDAFRLAPGETREISLPAYRFAGEGIYEFDLTAWARDELVGRLRLPTRVKVVSQ
ncbi:MAG: type II secretion system secretin GspD [Armatimonadetes bacterium]|nr:type II secretion system secretin GspD [Armatimonadota bacterium]